MDDLRNTSKVFTYLNPKEFRDIQKYFTLLRFPAHTPIIKQGDAGKGLYIIKQGKVAVVTHALCLGNVVLSELSGGSLIGETSLFAAQASSASVISTQEVEAYFLSNAFLQSFRLLNPLIADKIIQDILEITCRLE